MSEMDDLPESVRDAVEWMDTDNTVNPYWDDVRAELLRLAARVKELERESAELRSRCNVFVQSTARFRGDAERAESELAALKARIGKEK